MRRDLSYALLYCIGNNKFFGFSLQRFCLHPERLSPVMIIYYDSYGEIDQLYHVYRDVNNIQNVIREAPKFNLIKKHD